MLNFIYLSARDVAKITHRTLIGSYGTNECLKGHYYLEHMRLLKLTIQIPVEYCKLVKLHFFPIQGFIYSDVLFSLIIM